MVHKLREYCRGLSRQNRVLAWILAMAIVNAIYSTIAYCYLNPDTGSYLQAFNTLINGELDVWRTPVYPVVIGVVDTLCFQNLSVTYRVMEVLQFAFMIWSVKYFYSMCLSMGMRLWLAAAVTFVYATAPFTAGQAMVILTESFTISLTVMLAYTMMRLWNGTATRAHKAAFWALMILLPMLRPSSAYVIAPGLLLALVMWRRHRRGWTSVLAGSAASLAVLMVYSAMIWAKTGVFSPAVVSDINQYYILRQNGALRPEYADNPELREELRTTLAIKREYADSHIYGEVIPMMKTYGFDEVHRVNTRAIAADRMGYVRGIGERTARYLPGRPLSAAGNYYVLQPVAMALIPPFWLILVAAGLYPLLAAACFVIHRRKGGAGTLSPYLAVVYLLAFGLIVVTIVGAQWDWARLIVPAVPLMMILYAQLINSIIPHTRQ